MILEKRIARELNKLFEREKYTLEEKKHIIEELSCFSECLQDDYFMQSIPKTNPVYKVLMRALGVSDRTRQTLNNTIKTVQNKMQNIDFKHALSEAFSNRSAEKTASIFLEKLKSALPGDILQLANSEFENGEGTFQGLIYSWNSKMIRLNFKSDGSKSINLWKNPKLDSEGNFNTPDMEIIADNIEAGADKIVEVLKQKTLYEAKILLKENEEIKVEAGKPEKIELPNDEQMDAIVSKIQGELYSDPDEQFEEIKDSVDRIIEGVSYALLIAGDSGVGKTYTVSEKIEEYALKKGKDYVKFSGKMKTFALYKRLYEHNGKLLIFDDIDSVLQNKENDDILKAALDSYPEREISYETSRSFDPENYDDIGIKQMIIKGRLPSPFKFTGKVIFITNLKISQINTALKGRCEVRNLDLDPKDIMRIIERVMFITPIPGDPTEEVRKMTFKLLQEYYGSMKSEKPSIRLFKTCCMIFNDALKRNRGTETAVARTMRQILAR